jgi:hypothetical protein
MVAFAKLKERDHQQWSLRDVIVTLRSKHRIQSLVRLFPAVEEMIAAYLADEEVMPSILSTIATKIAPFEVVAALWDQALKKDPQRRMSLATWLKSESILILGSSPANRANIDPINRVLFKRLFDLLLDSENTTESISWVFLDEVREAGKLDGLSSLLNQGRSKGVAVVLGFQEIEGMFQEYGEHMAGEIFGQCAHKTFLRTGSPITANWIQSYWGESELMEVSFSSSVSRGSEGTSRSESVSYGKQMRSAVLASTVMQFPPTGEGSGVLAALHDIPGRAAIQQTEAWSDIAAFLKEDNERKAAAPPESLDECKWDDTSIDFELVRPWGPSDEKRLETAKKKPKTEQAEPPASASSKPEELAQSQGDSMKAPENDKKIEQKISILPPRR